MTRMYARGSALALLIGLALATPGVARAQWSVIEIGPSLIQTTLNTVNNLESLVTTIEDLAVQGEQLATEITAMERLVQDGTRVSGAEWARFQGQLAQLGSIVHTGNAIAYELSQVDAEFRRVFPGFEPPENGLDEYVSRSRATMDTLAGVLASAGANIGDAAQVQGSLNTLRSENESAVGQLAAAQTANRIASLEVGELVKLRQLVTAQTNALTVYYGQQLQRETAAEAAFERFVNVQEDVRPYAGSGFDALPSVCARPPCP